MLNKITRLLISGIEITSTIIFQQVSKYNFNTVPDVVKCLTISIFRRFYIIGVFQI
jgi:hypothetical protein